MFRLLPALLLSIFLVQCVREPVTFWAEGQWTRSGGRDPAADGNPKYDFAAGASGRLQIDLSAPTDAYLYLVSPEGKILAENSDADSTSGHARILFRVQAGEKYRVVAATHDPEKSGTFKLTLSSPPGSGAALIVQPAVGVAPGSLSVPERRAAVFTAGTSLVSGLQWRRDGVDIPGAVSAQYGILSAVAADAGEYACRVCAADRCTTSAPAALTVTAYRPSANTWNQERFRIGDWGDPVFSGDTARDRRAFQRYRDAHFNLASGFNMRPRPVAYLLDRVASVPGLTTFAMDGRVYGSGTAFDAEALAAAGGEFLGLPARRRNAFEGYIVSDEPWYRLADVDFSAGENLRKLEALSIADPGKVGWINLRANWGFRSFDEYAEYVRGYALNAETKVITFDYYPFTGSSTGYGAPGNGFAYFRHFRIYADAVKEARTVLGKTLYFWGFGCSVEHRIGDWAHLIRPDASQLRYQAFAPILYGAKGLMWFTYGLPGSGGGVDYLRAPESDTALYEDLSRVNAEIESMGPLLMELDWIAIVHGSAVDSLSGEAGLPTLADRPPLLDSGRAIPGHYAVGILRNRAADDTVLLILNKNITHPRTGALAAEGTNVFAVLGARKLQRFDKTGRRWLPLPAAYSDSGTAFVLDRHRPGDVELVRVAGP